jgi:hypothetical protein
MTDITPEERAVLYAAGRSTETATRIQSRIKSIIGPDANCVDSFESNPVAYVLQSRLRDILQAVEQERAKLDREWARIRKDLGME